MDQSRIERAPVIDDVAALAGVSVPTVSRVLTGAAPVSHEKRERVLRAIEVLQFRPSPTARALVSKTSRLVAVMAGNTSRYGYAETIRGIGEQAQSAGMSVIITLIESADPAHTDEAVELVLNQPIVGVIVLKFDAAGRAALRRIPGSVPVVAISGSRERRIPQARLTEIEGAERLVEHLLALGHRTVHHIRIPAQAGIDGRTIGWRRALRRSGIEPPLPMDTSWDPETGRELGLRLANARDVTAVFCGNDETAMAVMRGLADAGRQVPRDISVVGFDDHPLARLWVPSLTTVRQDFGALGAHAFMLLEERLAGEPKVQFESLPTELVMRESAAPPQ